MNMSRKKKMPRQFYTDVVRLLNEGNNVKTIAGVLNVSQTSVYSALKLCGIDIKKRKQKSSGPIRTVRLTPEAYEQLSQIAAYSSSSKQAALRAAIDNMHKAMRGLQ